MTLVASIQRSLDLIEGRLTAPVTMEALARQAGLSQWHFQRTFGALVGEGAGAYLRRRRLTEAARRLRGGKDSILEVALDFQFESHEAFTRAFRTEYLYTPSAWRRGRGALNKPVEAVRLTGQNIRPHLPRMNLTPDIITLPAATYVGLQAPFIMVISPDANNLAVIPQLWGDLMARRSELPPIDVNNWATFGLAQSPEQARLTRTHPDEAVYLASFSVPPDFKVPQGMVAWSVPENTYARFTHRGFLNRVGETYSAIYGKWLGSDGRQRGSGPDIERYDKRFNPHLDQSEFEILIPVGKG